MSKYQSKILIIALSFAILPSGVVLGDESGTNLSAANPVLRGLKKVHVAYHLNTELMSPSDIQAQENNFNAMFEGFFQKQGVIVVSDPAAAFADKTTDWVVVNVDVHRNGPAIYGTVKIGIYEWAKLSFHNNASAFVMVYSKDGVFSSDFRAGVLTQAYQELSKRFQMFAGDWDAATSSEPNAP